MTIPATEQTQDNAAPHIVIEPYYQDPQTGAVYVHRDLLKTRDDYTHESHIAPISADEQLGDVESWAEYVNIYGDKQALVTWNTRGLKAVLDYHVNGIANRCQWKASHPFQLSREWTAWNMLANGGAVPHRKAVEALEDMAEDIMEPAAADLMAIIRSLRANVNATAQTELRPDGGTSVSFSQDKKISGVSSNASLPAEISIAIPVLHGHVNERGEPVKYRLGVRLRASIDDNAHLALRLSMPNAARVLDDVIAERVIQAKALLGSDFRVLRAIG